MKRWNVLEHLCDEEEITGFLNAVIEDIKEGEATTRDFYRALGKAAQARAINQIVKDTGTDRQSLCDMFLADVPDSTDDLNENTDSILKAAKAFLEPAHV